MSRPFHRRIRSRRFALPAALAILAVAAWFRIAGTLAEPLWLDEAYSAYAAGKGFAFLWQVVPSYETHPPFYYSLLRIWTMAFGDSLGGHRALGIIAGLAALPMTYLAAREAALLLGRKGRLAGIVAAALVAIAPMAVEMSREVRPYPLMILAYAAALTAMFRIGRAVKDGRGLPRHGFPLWLLCLALMLWLHNLGPLFAGALGIGLLAMVAARGLPLADWRRLLIGHALVMAIWLPALMILADQAPTWMKSTWLRFEWTGLSRKLYFLYGVPGEAMLAAAALAVLGLWTLLRSGDGRRVAIALLAAAIVPVAASILVSVLVAPVFIVRIMTPVVVPTAILFALGIAGQRGWLRVAGFAALLWLSGQMIRNDLAARERGSLQDWYRAVAWLGPRLGPGDRVLAYPNEGALPLDYALRDRRIALPVDPVPVAVPAIGVGGWYPTGSRGVVSLPRDRLRAIARSDRVRAVPTVWLLRLGPWAYDKGDVFMEELSADRVPVARYRDGPIDIVGLRATLSSRTGLPLPSAP
ncbi:glycosyltransferase family 39 protein [Sphingomonas sp. 1P06PA]|uniref:hypothetical protein n=1 Tax=Sphingomonas sp. 1P06PA TaxID=554121 RepID=UPI0039A48F57